MPYGYEFISFDQDSLATMKNKRVLFLCTGNSARSQMAEGLLRHIAPGRFNVVSAGVNPTEVNPLSVKVMEEIGIDISRQRSKSVDEFLGQLFDYVITLCESARQSCPIFTGKYIKIHWDLEDPAQAQGTEEEKIKVFRKTRNQIKKHILKFLNLH